MMIETTNDLPAREFSDGRPDRHFDNQIFSVFAVLLFGPARFTRRSFDMFTAVQILQGRQLTICAYDDRSSSATVTTGRSAIGDILFTSRSDGTVAARSGRTFHSRYIEKLHIFKNNKPLLSNLLVFG